MATALPLIEKFGSLGSGTTIGDPAQFNTPIRIRVYGTEIFIIDSVNSRIVVTDMSGNYKRSFAVGAAVNYWNSGSATAFDIYNNQVYINYNVNGGVDITNLSGVIATNTRAFGAVAKFIRVTADYIIGVTNTSIYILDHSFNSLVSTSISGMGTVEGLDYYNGQVYICGQSNAVGHTFAPVYQVLSATDGSQVSVHYPTQSEMAGNPATGIAISNEAIYLISAAGGKVYVCKLDGSDFNYVADGNGNPFAPYDMCANSGNLFIVNATYNNILEYKDPVLTSFKDVKISGAWKTVTSNKICIGHAWKDIAKTQVKVGGIWKDNA